jgi:hypothetical protein
MADFQNLPLTITVIIQIFSKFVWDVRELVRCRVLHFWRQRTRFAPQSHALHGMFRFIVSIQRQARSAAETPLTIKRTDVSLPPQRLSFNMTCAS